MRIISINHTIELYYCTIKNCLQLLLITWFLSTIYNLRVYISQYYFNKYRRKKHQKNIYPIRESNQRDQEL